MPVDATIYYRVEQSNKASSAILWIRSAPNLPKVGSQTQPALGRASSVRYLGKETDVWSVDKIT